MPRKKHHRPRCANCGDREKPSKERENGHILCDDCHSKLQSGEIELKALVKPKETESTKKKRKRRKKKPRGKEGETVGKPAGEEESPAVEKKSLQEQEKLLYETDGYEKEISEGFGSVEEIEIGLDSENSLVTEESKKLEKDEENDKPQEREQKIDVAAKEKVEKEFGKMVDEKDKEIEMLKRKIEEMKKTFFEKNKYLKSAENGPLLSESLVQINSDLQRKLVESHKNLKSLQILHEEAVHELRKVINGKNEKLSKLMENYPDEGEDVFVPTEEGDMKELEEMEINLAKARADASVWIGKYNDILMVNDRLRATFEHLSLEKNKSEEDEETLSEDGESEVESSEGENKEKEPDVEEENLKMARKSLESESVEEGETKGGWLSGWL